MLLAIGLVFGLFIIPTYKARQDLKEKLKRDITTSFRTLFSDTIWNIINNADELCFGNISIGEKDKVIFLEKKCFVKPKVISKIKDIITNPYNYTYYQDWFIKENKNIEKGIVIFPLHNDFLYTYGSHRTLRPSVFSFDKYIKFTTKNQSITIIISEESAQVIIAQMGDETNDKMIFNANEKLDYLVSEVYSISGKRVVMDLEVDAMKRLLSLLESSQFKAKSKDCNTPPTPL